MAHPEDSVTVKNDICPFICQPGRLKCVQAIGWYLEEANMAQVSVNIADYEVTGIHTVYEECLKDANVSHCCSFSTCSRFYHIKPNN